ncbi:MAG: UDP-N-acetylmuramate dehydrogenase [Treponema sp.]|nr:UDP-N-acetylmuramate dehydrogenase [Treponema sp.]MCL2236999.1 UDP-N-acetylmuramate dehydrogenase [Treponema sp.]
MQAKKLIEQCLKDNPCEIEIRYDEPMKDHTTFKVGGKADCYICPDGEGFLSFCTNLLTRAKAAEVPVFILGGGANIVVSEKGIRGITVDMAAWNGESVWTLCCEKDEIVFKSGTAIDEAADAACAAGLGGMEFLAGMPGTIGGAVWMNARCYGKEISDILKWVEVIAREKASGVNNKDFEIKRIEIKNGEGFDYKKSPFQEMDCMILSAAFKLKKGDKKKMLVDMENNRQDRQDKGHYQFPCAGSAFKNNHDFGKPTGQIIDELGLKGFSKGGAQAAPFHGNIIINTGNATADDIRSLMDDIALKVKEKTGFVLEPEILFVGDWS